MDVWLNLVQRERNLNLQESCSEVNLFGQGFIYACLVGDDQVGKSSATLNTIGHRMVIILIRKPSLGLSAVSSAV